MTTHTPLKSVKSIKYSRPRHIKYSALERSSIDSFVTAVYRLFSFSTTGTNYRLRKFFLTAPLKRISNNGVPGLKVWKDLMNWTIRLILESKSVNPRPPTRVPHILRYLIRYSRRGERERLFGLSLCSTYRLFKVRPDYNLKNLVAESKERRSLLLGWEAQLEKAIQRMVQTWRVEPKGPWPRLEWVVSTKAGPNGPQAWTHFEDDLTALRNSGLMINIREYINAFNFPNDWAFRELVKRHSDPFHIPLEFNEPVATSRLITTNHRSLREILSFPLPGASEVSITKDEGDIHSRLHFLQDKGGKTRVIAMGDIFTQTLLKPVHTRIFKVLSKVPEDGTHDQEAARSLVLDWTLKRKHLYSFDMTACTDRMPVWIQRYVLSNTILTQEESIAWEQLVSNRTFSTKVGGYRLSLRYSVGQPMGFYSSWAAMALSHHAIVYWAATILGLDPIGKYVILGDDIVISDPSIARQYRRLILALGIEISAPKSFVEVGLAEFGKGFYKDGKDFKPLSPDLFLYKGARSWSVVLDLCESVFRKGYWGGMLTHFKKAFPRLPVQKFVTLCTLRGCVEVLGIINEVKFPKNFYDTYSTVMAFNNIMRSGKRISSRATHFCERTYGVYMSPLKWYMLDRISDFKSRYYHRPKPVSKPDTGGSSRQALDDLFSGMSFFKDLPKPRPEKVREEGNWREGLILVGPNWVSWDPWYWDRVVHERKQVTYDPPIFSPMRLFDLDVSPYKEELNDFPKRIKGFLRGRLFELSYDSSGRRVVRWLPSKHPIK